MDAPYITCLVGKGAEGTTVIMFAVPELETEPIKQFQFVKLFKSKPILGGQGTDCGRNARKDCFVIN